MTERLPPLTVEGLIKLNKEVLHYGGGLHAVLYEDGLHYAVDRPWLTFGGEPQYPTPYGKAAALMEVLIRNHPFADGNKRTAFTAGAALLLLLTGERINPPTDQVVAACLAVERKDWKTAELAAWFRKYVT